MSYPKQSTVADKLQNQSLKVLDVQIAKDWRKIEFLWRQARLDMRAHIAAVYHRHFGNDRWNITALRASGGWSVLEMNLRARIAKFRDESRVAAMDAINALYKESLLRHAWVIDQTTPPNIKVRIPYKQKLFEAGRSQVTYYGGPQAAQAFSERWNTWSDGYYSALMTNLQLNAINEGTVSDATEEVDATRVNTPAFGLLDALQRMFSFETMNAINQAVSAVSDVNEEADVVQIWQTRQDMKVCDDCDENLGLTEEDADGEIPLHPNCNCYWRVVPASWAQLLRSGDESDYEIATRMDAKGLVPNAMAITDSEGNLAGYTTVEFGKWKNSNFNLAAVGR